MTNYVKHTWADGSGGATPITAAKLTEMESGIYDAHFTPAARAYHSANQSITTATWTALALNSERFDTDVIHDTVTNNSRLTCKTAGKYQISGNVEWASNATGTRQLQVWLNGATDIGHEARQASTGGVMSMSISVIYDLAVNDYVELRVNQDSGGGLNVNSTGNYTPEFSMVRVG